MRRRLEILDGCKQHAGVTHQRPSRFDQDFLPALAYHAPQRFDIFLCRGGIFPGITYPQASTQIEVLDLQPLRLQSVEQPQHLFAGFDERRQFRQLRADMAIETSNPYVVELLCSSIKRLRSIERNAELVFLE